MSLRGVRGTFPLRQPCDSQTIHPENNPRSTTSHALRNPQGMGAHPFQAKGTCRFQCETTSSMCNAPSPHLTRTTTEPGTITNDSTELNSNLIIDAVGRVASSSPSETGFTNQAFIMNLNSRENPIDDGPDGGSDDSFDDGSDDWSNDVPLPRSTKQLFQHRQRYVEKMDPPLDWLTSYVQSTADSDQSGDYDKVTAGEKRSFEDFVSDELNDSERPKEFIEELASAVEEYQGLLRRIKEFRRT